MELLFDENRSNSTNILNPINRRFEMPSRFVWDSFPTLQRFMSVFSIRLSRSRARL